MLNLLDLSTVKQTKAIKELGLSIIFFIDSHVDFIYYTIKLSNQIFRKIILPLGDMSISDKVNNLQDFISSNKIDNLTANI